jgi:rubrerythrin
MERFSVTEAVEMAVQTERLGYQFYKEMAGKFKDNKRLADLFTTLANKERAHERIFEELKDTVVEAEPEGWEEAQNYFRAMMQSEFFMGKGKSLPSMKNIRSLEDAVDFALGFEKETLLYYLGLRGAVSDTKAVDDIIEEERSHIAWLNGFKGSLKS